MLNLMLALGLLSLRVGAAQVRLGLPVWHVVAGTRLGMLVNTQRSSSAACLDGTVVNLPPASALIYREGVFLGCVSAGGRLLPEVEEEVFGAVCGELLRLAAGTHVARA